MTKRKPRPMDIKEYVLWSDESLLAINKPSGLRSIPDGYQPDLPNLASLLQTAFGRVWVIHRLDKDTSGVILFARSAEIHRAMNIQFEMRETRKEYHAIVVGIPAWEDANITLPLLVNGDRRHRTVINHQTGKQAATSVHVLQQLGAFALLAAFPHTGYTHQIRAHLSAVDLPLLADPLYQSLEPETQARVRAREIIPTLPIQRTALHAYQITFMHPISGASTTLSAPYPQDFQKTLEILEDIARAP